MLKGIKDLKYLAKGKRSEVYIGDYRKKKIIIKKSKRAKIEAKWLKILNKYQIGPKFIFLGKNYLVYEFVKGERILEHKGNIKKIIKKVLEQCRKMDKLGINKKEMQNPYKHILIDKNKVKMIDFERCYYSKKVKNVTQFCQFLREKIFRKLDKKKLVEILKNYKKNPSDKNYSEILEFLKL